MVENYNELKLKYGIQTVVMAFQNLLSVAGQTFTEENIDKAYQLEKERQENAHGIPIISAEQSLLIMRCSKELSELNLNDIVHLVKEEFSSSHDQNREQFQRDQCIAITKHMTNEVSIKSDNMHDLIYKFNKNCDDFKIVPLPENLYTLGVTIFDVKNSMVSEAYKKVDDLVTILKVILDISEEELEEEFDDIENEQMG